MSTRNQIEIESQKDPATLEREIDQQRAEISHIVEELEHKLSPGEMMDRVLGYARGNGGEFFDNLTNTVKANPVPTLLTGIGIAWLMAGQNRQPPRYDATAPHASVGDKLSHTGGAAKERAAHMRDSVSQSTHRVGESMHNASARVGDSVNSARMRISESTHHAGESLRHGADRARSSYERLRTEQPLALGAIGLALGALFASALPPTRREDELMGETRDQMKERARQKAEEGYQQVSAKTEEVASQMRQERSNGQTQHAAGPH